MKRGPECRPSVPLDLAGMALLLSACFLVACLIIVVGISFYLWFEEPTRVVFRVSEKESFGRTNIELRQISPQPLQVSTAESGVRMMDPFAIKGSNVTVKPSLEEVLSGLATNGAVWVTGKPFKSGTRAAWELARNAWPLWLLGAGSLICTVCLYRHLKGKCEVKAPRHPPPSQRAFQT